jgi:CTP:molybdopterin cytidylyltransferase MocA
VQAGGELLGPGGEPALVEEVPAAIIPAVAGRGGHPALISRSLFPALARCADAPEGARSVLRAAVTRRVELPDRGCIDDVDVPADVAALEASR